MAVGFFGKLPSSGDFVARGLGPKVRPCLDRWLTTHLAELVRNPEHWPKHGLRALIDGPGSPLLLAIIPSHDSAGRAFPLAACCTVDSIDQEGADLWADAISPHLLDARDALTPADALSQTLATCPAPLPSEPPNLTSPLAWAKGERAQALGQVLASFVCTSDQ
jgi:type VI secretion system protein ImpM